MSKDKILVVDDEQSMREFLEIALKKEGYEISSASGGKEAMKLLEKEEFDLVISDLRMHKMDGLELLSQIKNMHPEVMVIMVTAFATAETAVKAMKQGAYDYIIKPFEMDELKLIIKNALEKKNLQRENIFLKKELKKKYTFGNIIGSSPKMLEIYELIRMIADTKVNILISGESGTGKELIAKAIHYNSSRKDYSFVAVDCGAIPENLLESEFFGHKKGAFTGAFSDKVGLFEAAHRGTIFLDEITELPFSLQVKLLRVIQEKEFRSVGDTKTKKVDVRIMAATNRNMEEMVKAGTFREDLFYRLNVVLINVPSLRERKEDIPMLAHYFLEKYSKEIGKNIKKISNPAMEILVEYDYPGNVRELGNIIERCVALEVSDIILPETLPASLNKVGAGLKPTPTEIPSDGLDNYMGNIEKDFLLAALKKAKGIRKEAAKLLKITPRSLRYRLKKLKAES